MFDQIPTCPGPCIQCQDTGSDPIGNVRTDNLEKMRDRARAAVGANCAQSSEAIPNSLCVGFLIDGNLSSLW